MNLPIRLLKQLLKRWPRPAEESLPTLEQVTQAYGELIAAGAKPDPNLTLPQQLVKLEEEMAAGTGMGKTTFAQSLVLALKERGERMGWIGLEETVEEIEARNGEA